jgi:hypothetical protein
VELKSFLSYQQLVSFRLDLISLSVIPWFSFYYGVFEYPRNSGNWYTEKFPPIISRELFEKVQEKLNEEIYTKGFKGKEFAFTKILHCGLCGSGITAEEKWKKLKDGGANQHVYLQMHQI